MCGRSLTVFHLTNSGWSKSLPQVSAPLFSFNFLSLSVKSVQLRRPNYVSCVSWSWSTTSDENTYYSTLLWLCLAKIETQNNSLTYFHIVFPLCSFRASSPQFIISLVKETSLSDHKPVTSALVEHKIPACVFIWSCLYSSMCLKNRLNENSYQTKLQPLSRDICDFTDLWCQYSLPITKKTVDKNVKCAIKASQAAQHEI